MEFGVSSPPPEVLRFVEERFGAVHVLGPIGGGCVNPAVRVRLRDGDAFLKYNMRAHPALFAVEARGLDALRTASDSLRVPEVLGVWMAEAPGAAPGPGALLLEWLEPGREDADFGSRLGRAVAEMHRTTGAWGWEEDGFIGPLPQENSPACTWAEFWRTRRLEPQLRRARKSGVSVATEGEWEALWDALPALLAPAEAEGASLLHGDLWNGNVLAVASAEGVSPALVDPAVYRGHREVDLAMAELFGGFDPSFFTAYHESFPLAPGYQDGRRAVYQLFYLLVHVNLFGAGYLGRAERALRQALRAR